MIGFEAKNQQNLNTQNTIYGFKHLLGKKFADTSKYDEKFNFKVCKMTTGTIGCVVEYLEQDKFCLTLEQVLAMLFTEIVSDINGSIIFHKFGAPSYA